MEEMTVRVLWASKYKACPSQIAALHKMFGSDVIIGYTKEKNAEKIAEIFYHGRYNEIVVIAPLWTIAVLYEQEAIQPLWAESIKETDPSKIEYLNAKGQGFRFDRFRRIKRLELEFEKKPPQPVEVHGVRILWMSSNQVHPEEMAMLRQIFGYDVAIIPDTVPFEDAADIVKRFQNGDYFDLVVIAPLPILGALCCEEKLPPLYTKPADDGGFFPFRRIAGLVFEFED